MSLDVLYVAWNRLEFTRASFSCLLRNTDWRLVDRLVVVDDGSVDGTREYLEEAIRGCPVAHELVHLGFRHPVHAMLHYLGDGPAEFFVKVDNDIALPPDWLHEMLCARTEDLDFLGCEAGMTSSALDYQSHRERGARTWREARWIGGVGLMRTGAFTESRVPLRPRGHRYGFTEWQQVVKPRCGWITPDLAVLQLDRMPTEPWRSLSESYLAAGWQRGWPTYHPVWMAWAWAWLNNQQEVLDGSR